MGRIDFAENGYLRKGWWIKKIPVSKSHSVSKSNRVQVTKEYISIHSVVHYASVLKTWITLRKNAGYYHFLLFTQCFESILLQDCYIYWDCVVRLITSIFQLQLIYGVSMTSVYYGYFVYYINRYSKKDDGFPFSSVISLLPSWQKNEVGRMKLCLLVYFSFTLSQTTSFPN